MPQTATRSAWELVPFESVGPLRMGMSKAEVAAAPEEAPTRLPRTPGPPALATTQQTFTDAGVHVVYDLQGKAIAVEAFGRPLMYRGVTLGGDRPVADLHALGVEVSEDDPAGPDARDIGVLMTLEPEGDVSGVMAVRSDYREVVGL